MGSNIEKMSILFENLQQSQQHVYLKKFELHSGNDYIEAIDRCTYKLGNKRTVFRFETVAWELTYCACTYCINSILDIDGSCLSSDKNCSLGSQINSEINICEYFGYNNESDITNNSNLNTSNNTNSSSNDSNTNASNNSNSNTSNNSNSNTSNNTNTTNDTNNSNTTNDTNNNNISNNSNSGNHSNISNNNSDSGNIINNSCLKNEVLIANSCKSCALIEGIHENCSDICGNGILYNFTGNIYCDDGNTVSHDGCSSECLIENDFICIRKNFSSPDKCYLTASLSIKLKATQMATLSYIHFDRPIVNYLQGDEQKSINFTNIIELQLENIPYNNYLYQILFVDNKTLQIDLESFISFNPLTMIVIFNSPHQIRDENNVSLIGNINNTNSPPLILKTRIPLYFKASKEDKDRIEQIYVGSKTASYTILLLSSIPLIWLCILQFLWYMLDAMQITNLFLYINIVIPDNAKQILLLFAESNLYFISNTMNSIFQLNYKASSFDNPDLKAPDNFDQLNITPLFLVNSGFIIVIVSLMYFLLGIIEILDRNLERYKKFLCLRNFITKIKSHYHHPLILRVQSICFLTFCLSIALQLRCASIVNTLYFYNYIFAGLFLFYFPWFFFHLFKISNNENTFFQVEEYMKHYSLVFQQSNMEILYGRNFFLWTCIQKFFITFLVVLFYDWPYVQISLIILWQILEIFLIFRFDVYSIKIMNYFARFCSIILLLSLLMLLIIKIYYDSVISQSVEITDENVASFFFLGWILLVLVFSSMLVFCLIVNWTVFLMFKSIFKRFRDKNGGKSLRFKKVEESNSHEMSNYSSKREKSPLDQSDSIIK